MVAILFNAEASFKNICLFNYVDQSSSRDDNRCSAIKDISRLLLNPKIHKCLPVGCTLSHLHPVHTATDSVT
jgi:hypothetical protein